MQGRCVIAHQSLWRVLKRLLLSPSDISSHKKHHRFQAESDGEKRGGELLVAVLLETSVQETEISIDVLIVAVALREW